MKKLYVLTKPRSPHLIEITTEDLPDEWLIDVTRYIKKSMSVKESFMILRKDLEHRLELWKEDGWVAEKV